MWQRWREVCGCDVYLRKLNSLSGCLFCNIFSIILINKKYEGLVHIFIIPNSVLTVRRSTHRWRTKCFGPRFLRWNLKAHGDARAGKWRWNWRMEWVASTLHTTSEHGVSSITTADAHTSTGKQSTELTPPGRFKWTRPFRRKTSSGFCACAITFQLESDDNGANCGEWTIGRKGCWREPTESRIK